LGRDAQAVVTADVTAPTEPAWEPDLVPMEGPPEESFLRVSCTREHHHVAPERGGGVLSDSMDAFIMYAISLSVIAEPDA
jgi:hypothetical protein